jgi:hypothetical protein
LRATPNTFATESDSKLTQTIKNILYLFKNSMLRSIQKVIKRCKTASWVADILLDASILSQKRKVPPPFFFGAPSPPQPSP